MQWAYLYILAIPALWLKGIISFPLTVIHGYRAFLLLSDAAVVKLAASKTSTIGREYANYIWLTQCQPNLVGIFPNYRYSRNALFSWLQSERLSPVPVAEALPLAVAARRQLDRSMRAAARLVPEQCPQILAGLRCIEAQFGARAAEGLRAVVADFLATGRYEVGLAHGDFHSRNLMRDQSGNFRLIDLDCVRLNGIAEFDALYFALEMEWSASGVLWTETLTYCFATQGRNIARYLAAFGVPWADALGFAFFLDRVGQDFLNYGFWYTREQLASVVDASQSSTAARNQ